MDAVARSRRLFLIPQAALAAAAALGFACERPAESPVGVSSAQRPHGAVAPDAGAAPAKRELAILPQDFRTQYAKLSSARFASVHGLVGLYEAEVYANDAAKGAFPLQNGTFPQGAVLVAEHWERGATPPKAGPTMAMEKMAPGFDPEHGDWRFVSVTPEGDIAADGKPDGCVLCHDEAPHDHVFVVR